VFKVLSDDELPPGSGHIIFKGAATWAASNRRPFQSFYEACLARGMKPHLERLILARKIAAITLLVWKRVCFDAGPLKQQEQLERWRASSQDSSSGDGFMVLPTLCRTTLLACARNRRRRHIKR